MNPYLPTKLLNFQAGRNPCRYAGCGHHCLLTGDSDYFVCACPEELRLAGDRKTCRGNPNEVSLVVADQSKLYSVKERKYTGPVVKLIDRTRLFKHISDLDYDPLSGKLYICDKEAKKIFVMDMKTNNPVKVVVDNLYTPTGIAVDWARQNLYFVDPFKRKLEVVNLSGSNSFRATLSLNTSCRAVDVAVSRRRGQLVIACDSPRGRILRCTRSGGPCLVLVEGIRSPLGLSIDQRSTDGDYVYWTDSYHDVINGVSLDGVKKKPIAIKGPAGILISHNRLFFTTVANHRSFFELKEGSSRHIDLKVQTDISTRDHMALTEIGWNGLRSKTDENFCMAKEGLCSQLCLEDQYGNRKCGCENNKQLEGTVSCVSKNCGSGSFMCHSDGKCIAQMFTCNGVKNCDDGSDEFNCTSQGCGSNQFTCEFMNECISSDKKCDGHADCLDSSDERNCDDASCGKGHSPCANGFGCYFTSHKCSGSYPQCADFSDQKDCPPCKNGEFKCSGGEDLYVVFVRLSKCT